jgi:signal transduction histidine kinase
MFIKKGVVTGVFLLTIIVVNASVKVLSLEDSLKLDIERELSLNSIDSQKVFDSYQNLITYYDKSGAVKKSRKTFTEQLLYCDEKKTRNAFTKRIGYYEQINKPEIGIELCRELLKLQPNNQKSVYRAYTGIASIFYGEFKFDEAINAFERALQAARKLNNQDLINTALMNMGSALYEKGDADSATKIFKHVLREIQKAKAEDKAYLSSVFINLGAMYYDINTDSSIKYFELGKEYALMSNSIREEAIACMNLGLVFTKTKQLNKSKLEYERCLELFSLLGVIRHHPKVLQELALIESKLGSYKIASELSSMSRKYADSLNNEARIKAVAEAQSKFGILEKELRNRILIKENEAHQQVIQNQRLVVMTIGLFLISALVLIVVFYNKRMVVKRLNHDLQLKNENLDKLLKEKDALLAEKDYLLKEKDHFMGILVHDIRTPLSGMQSVADLLKRPNMFDNTSEYNEILDELFFTSQHGLNMIGSIWDIYKLEQNTEEIQLMEIKVDDICIDLEREFSVLAGERQIQLDFDGSSVSVYSRKDMLQILLRNLISNALKFSPEGTTVSLRAKRLTDSVYILVRDEGPGFKNTDKAKMFKKFQSLSAQPLHGEKSSGMGLYMVKLVAEKLKADVSLNEKYKNGAEMVVRVPFI